jgi:N-acetylglutamate synthase-like GNAT family acetyltransferase
LTDAPDAEPATRIRRAQPADAAVLTSLALASKAAWGYDESFMAACRAELTITPQSVLRQPTHVIERQGQVLGFYQLRIDGAVAEVTQLFIAPGMLRRGLGRRLWAHLDQTARAAGAARLEVDSDPHAETFYLAMGMRRIGEAPSGSIAGRMLPRLAKEIAQAAVQQGSERAEIQQPDPLAGTTS